MLFLQNLLSFFHYLTGLLQRIESMYYFLLLMGCIVMFSFLSSQGNQHMIHQDLDLFYEIYNTTAELN